MITCDDTTMGSTPDHGWEPCVCRPFTTMVKLPAAAICGPARTPIEPTGMGQTCSPNTASGTGSRSTPSSIIAFAPPSPSSAGWKMNFTVPGSWAFMPASTSATPIRMATWLSWPQACITPTEAPCHCAVARLLNGRSTCSVTGRPSMSARRATTGPGRPPRRMPTTPVLPTCVCTSMPRPRRCSATSAAVRVSSKLSSGCSWMSRRHATTLGITAGRRASMARTRSEAGATCACAGEASSGIAKAVSRKERRRIGSGPEEGER
jgi:hypothetical protein